MPIKRDEWSKEEAISILGGRKITLELSDEYGTNRNKGINKAIYILNILDRFSDKKIWSNDELIEIVEDIKIPIKMDDAKSWSKAKYDSAVEYNQGLEQAVIQLWDLKADPEKSWSAMALDTETGQIVVISPPLPR